MKEAVKETERETVKKAVREIERAGSATDAAADRLLSGNANATCCSHASQEHLENK